MVGIKIDLKKLAIGALKVAVPAAAVALVTRTSVKKAVTGAAEKAVRETVIDQLGRNFTQSP